MAQPKKPKPLTDEQKRAALEAALAAQKPPAIEGPGATVEDGGQTIRIRLTDPGVPWRPSRKED